MDMDMDLSAVPGLWMVGELYLSGRLWVMEHHQPDKCVEGTWNLLVLKHLKCVLLRSFDSGIKLVEHFLFL